MDETRLIHIISGAAVARNREKRNGFRPVNFVIAWATLRVSVEFISHGLRTPPFCHSSVKCVSSALHFPRCNHITIIATDDASLRIQRVPIHVLLKDLSAFACEQISKADLPDSE